MSIRMPGLVSGVFRVQERIPDEASREQCKSNADQKSDNRSIFKMRLKNKGGQANSEQQK